MKVSLVIPVYNAEKWLNDTLESIHSQTYRDVEIILVNDGSTDRSLEILRRYAQIDKRIIIVNKPNSGTYESRRLGVEKSTGEAVFNMDADDFLVPDAIKLLVRRMQDTQADIVIGNHYQLQNGRKKLVQNFLPENQNRPELLKSLLQNKIKGYIWGKLYKREMLLNQNYKVPRLLQEDVLTNLHILLNNDVTLALEPTPVYYYRVHENSANSSKDPDFIENVYKFIGITRNLLEEANLLENMEENLRLFNCRNWIVYSRLGGKLAKNKSFRSRFIKENYTAYSFLNLPMYQNLEMVAYKNSFQVGQFTTHLLKQIQKVAKS